MLTLIVLLLVVGALSRRRWFYRPFFFRPMGGLFWGNVWMRLRPPMGGVGPMGPGFGPGPRMGGFGPMGGPGMGRHGRW